MSESAVLLEVRDKICQLTLNRPANRNSIDDEIPLALKQRLEELKGIKDVRCIILTGSGSTFCGGGDFRSELFKHIFDDKTLLANEAIAKKIYGPVVGLLDVDIPIIAAMNGHAIGGGLGVARCCVISGLRIERQNTVRTLSVWAAHLGWRFLTLCHVL